MKLAIVLLIIATGLTGCSAGPTHWKQVPDPHFREEDQLVCNSSGMTVAGVYLEMDGAWHAWGWNGALYGEYETKAQAQRAAESIVTGGLSFRMGSKWLTCR